MFTHNLRQKISMTSEVYKTTTELILSHFIFSDDRLRSFLDEKTNLLKEVSVSIFFGRHIFIHVLKELFS